MADHLPSQTSHITVRKFASDTNLTLFVLRDEMYQRKNQLEAVSELRP